MRELATARLRLRSWRAADAPFLLDLESREQTVRYLGSGARPMANLAEAEASIRRRRAVRAPGCGIWAVESLDGGALVGNLLCKPLDPGRPGGPSAEIGWHMHPDFHGRGYATEAAAAAISYAEDSGLLQLDAVIDARNMPSLAVCRRLGFHWASSHRDDDGAPRLTYRLALPR